MVAAAVARTCTAVVPVVVVAAVEMDCRESATLVHQAEVADLVVVAQVVQDPSAIRF